MVSAKVQRVLNILDKHYTVEEQRRMRPAINKKTGKIDRMDLSGFSIEEKSRWHRLDKTYKLMSANAGIVDTDYVIGGVAQGRTFFRAAEEYGYKQWSDY